MPDSFADIAISIFLFKVNYIFMEEKDKKVVTDEEEIDCIKIDGLLNLENVPRTVLID